MDDGEHGRHYRFPDSKLSLFAGTLIIFAQRDWAGLSAKGLSTHRLSELISYHHRFREFPTDEDIQGRILEAGEKRDALWERLETAVQNVVNRTTEQFKAESSVLSRMNGSNTAHATDDEFLTLARRVYSVAMEVRQELEGVDVTAQMLQDFHDLIDAFEQAVNERLKRISERTDATRTRIVLGNDLYELCVAVCSIGKQAYRNKNYAKYADYVIYEGSTPGEVPGIPTNLRYANNQVDWDEVEGAGSYHLEMRLDKEAEFNEVYFGELTHFDFTLPNPPVQGVSAYLFRVRAQNSAGMGEYSTVLSVAAQ